MSISSSVPRKKPVNVTLSPDLVSEARGYTSNLSETLEGLLEGYVARERLSREHRRNEMIRCLSAWNAHHATHLNFADEFGKL